MTHTLRQNKDIHFEKETGKDIPIQGNKSNTSNEDSGREVFQAKGPFLCGRVAVPSNRQETSCLLS